MPLDLLESDFLGELSSDTHGVWEIFEFVRLHYPDRDDTDVFKIGTRYLTRWIERGWIKVSDKPLHPTPVGSVDEILSFVKKHGVAATVCIKDSPSLDITKAGLTACQKTPDRSAASKQP